MSHPLVALVAGAVGLASGAVVPPLIRRLPPVAVDGDTPEDPAGSVDVAAVADQRGLAVRAAVAGALAAGAMGLVLGRAWPLLYLVPLVPVGVALAAVDWRTRLLPSRLVLPSYGLVGVGVVVAWLLAGRPDGPAPLLRALVGLVLAFGFFFAVWFVHPRGLGFGDVRLAGVLGLGLGYLGWAELVIGLYAGFLLGGVIGGVLALARVVDRSGYPFGPFMLAGALLGVVAGPAVAGLLTG